jgi:chemotaxis protein methyltransferase WspC
VTAEAKGKVDLEQASRLADEGRLREAADICEAHLRQEKTSVRARYLLGLVRDAAGELAAARDQYRQVLYLDPNHHEALMHLALVTAKLGDEAGARQLRERARRVEAKLKRVEPPDTPRANAR